MMDEVFNGSVELAELVLFAKVKVIITISLTEEVGA